jgi:PAS domain S-box-containing protein
MEANGKQEGGADNAQTQGGVMDPLLSSQPLFEFASDAYLLTDLSGIIHTGNHMSAALLGMPRDFLPGKPLAFLVAPPFRPAFYERLMELRRSDGTVGRWEMRLGPPRGLPRDVSVTVTTALDAYGRPEGFRWLLRDVTAQRRAEQALRSEQEFAHALLQTTQAIILVVAGDGRIIRSNPFVRQTAGLAEDELRGRDWCALLLPEDEWPRGRALVAQALASGLYRAGIHPMRTRDGGRRSIAWSARALTPTEEEQGVLLIGHDVTDLLEAQEHLMQAERLAAIGQTMTGLAHESRNAVQRTRACLERLRWRVQDRPDAIDLVDRATQAQEDLVRLFEDVRSYAAPIRLAPTPCDLAAVWRQAWDQVVCLFPGRQARLCEETAGVDLDLQADGYRLTQVFRNILDNVFAAADGEVRVDVACREAVLGNRPAVQVGVRDHGPGMDAEQRRRAFEPFFTTKVKGTGLGLAIARRIVEAHGGQIAFADRPPPGAEVLITLPRRL